MTELQLHPRYATYPSERVIPLQGSRNFRDMGGYPAADGRKVKYGIFFRADELTGLTEEDIAFLETLGIRTIFDYRSDDEAAHKPDPVLRGALNERVSAIPGLAAYRSHEDALDASFIEQFTEDMLANMYGTLPIRNASYKRLMELVADTSKLGLVHHCAAGKDRTGVGAALILSLLGVPRAVIVEDYLITNRTMAHMTEGMMAQLAGKLTEAQLAIVTQMMGASEAFIQSAFTAIEGEYGSMEAYFEAEFGLTAEKIEQIRSYCLE
ncbi:protein-tyrosine phosphatase [Paenibacillus phyllosphaerae]|uniref:Protein-tyrosine phosphatase n=1 Tax=Paenibacillus phyllosphaerae TaxID=274593 RepID=A0A7W5B3W9_9BACL|nr:tyrosine-protein phosphatase [Paenibacillus phyllosphaerae]MBB3113945.1 protein-tyrosine phosphatase [Paenibacillus phyllosphaerae]